MLEKEVNVFEVGLHVFVDDYLPVCKQIVFNLYFPVSEYLQVTFRNNYLLVSGGSFLIADSVEHELKKRHQVFALLLVDFEVVFVKVDCLRKNSGNRESPS